MALPETQPRSSKRGPPSSRAPGSAPRSSKRDPVDLAALLPTLKDALERERALKKTDLGALGVPRPQQDEAISLLQEEGYELAGAGIRVPLTRQLRELLAQKQMVQGEPARLKAHLHGAPKTAEIKLATRGLLDRQEARLILRGKKKLYLAQPQFRALSAAQVQQLQRKAAELAAFCKDALSQKPTAATLFWYDVNEQLDALRKILPPEETTPAKDVASTKGTTPAKEAALARSTAPGTPVRKPSEAVVLEALRSAPGPSAGLASVPKGVQLLEQEFDLSAIHEVLIALDRGRRIELHAEAGRGRFSQRELDRCPPGPRGFSLVWAHLKEEKS